MNDLYAILFWSLLGLVVIVTFFLPRSGLLARWRRNKEINQKHFLEDSLKLIYHAQQEDHPADKYQLAVELDINVKNSQTIIDKLEAQQLAVIENGRLRLTPSGQKYALQVIRAHRLWEKYLADEARMPLDKIHKIANLREHQMSEAEIDSLDAELGHPSRDPHGDPIPNKAGDLREVRTDTLVLDLEVGQHGKISHMEDEPSSAFSQLVAQGLYVGQNIIVRENNPQNVVLGSGDEAFVLSKSIARNVFIQVEQTQEEIDASNIPLFHLSNREKAEIVKIDERCQGFTRRRFLDLGLTPGTPIFPELENSFKDPRAYRVRGTLIALRRDQAELIWVRPI